MHPSMGLAPPLAASISTRGQSSGITRNPKPLQPFSQPLSGGLQQLLTLPHNEAPRHLPTCLCCRRNSPGQPLSAPAG